MLKVFVAPQGYSAVEAFFPISPSTLPHTFSITTVFKEKNNFDAAFTTCFIRELQSNHDEAVTSFPVESPSVLHFTFHGVLMSSLSWALSHTSSDVRVTSQKRSCRVASSATQEPLISNRKQNSDLVFSTNQTTNQPWQSLWSFMLAIPCVLSSFADALWISLAQLQNQNQENTCHSYWKNNWTVVALSPVSH